MENTFVEYSRNLFEGLYPELDERSNALFGQIEAKRAEGVSPEELMTYAQQVCAGYSLYECEEMHDVFLAHYPAAHWEDDAPIKVVKEALTQTIISKGSLASEVGIRERQYRNEVAQRVRDYNQEFQAFLLVKLEEIQDSIEQRLPSFTSQVEALHTAFDGGAMIQEVDTDFVGEMNQYVHQFLIETTLVTAPQRVNQLLKWIIVEVIAKVPLMAHLVAQVLRFIPIGRNERAVLNALFEILEQDQTPKTTKEKEEMHIYNALAARIGRTCAYAEDGKGRDFIWRKYRHLASKNPENALFVEKALEGRPKSDFSEETYLAGVLMRILTNRPVFFDGYNRAQSGRVITHTEFRAPVVLEEYEKGIVQLSRELYIVVGSNISKGGVLLREDLTRLDIPPVRETELYIQEIMSASVDEKRMIENHVGALFHKAISIEEILNILQRGAEEVQQKQVRSRSLIEACSVLYQREVTPEETDRMAIGVLGFNAHLSQILGVDLNLLPTKTQHFLGQYFGAMHCVKIRGDVNDQDKEAIQIEFDEGKFERSTSFGGVEELLAVLGKMEGRDEKMNFLISFQSLESESREMGARLLDLAEFPQARPLFRSYAKIALLSQETARQIQAYDNRRTQESIETKLLQSSRRLIEEVHEAVFEPHKSPSNRQKAIQLAQKLGYDKWMTSNFVQAYSGASSQPKDMDLAEAMVFAITGERLEENPKSLREAAKKLFRTFWERGEFVDVWHIFNYIFRNSNKKDRWQMLREWMHFLKHGELEKEGHLSLRIMYTLQNLRVVTDQVENLKKRTPSKSPIKILQRVLSDFMADNLRETIEELIIAALENVLKSFEGHRSKKEHLDATYAKFFPGSIHQPDPQKVEQFAEQIRRKEVAASEGFMRASNIAEELVQANAQARQRLLKRVDEMLSAKNSPALFSQDIAPIFESPDRLPESELSAYFSVGIGKELDQELKASEKQRMKPTDIYSFLFWSQNQDRPVDIVVCDRMQVSNYYLEHPDLLDPNNPVGSAVAYAEQFGRQERQFYERIIEVFGLTNVRIRSYDFLEQNLQFEARKELCKRLEKRAAFKKGFQALEIERRKESEYEPQQLKLLRDYAVTEVAWILSHRGQKISHPNEARIGYDPLAMVILNLERFMNQQNKPLQKIIEAHEIQIEALVNEHNRLVDRFKKKRAIERVKANRAFKRQKRKIADKKNQARERIKQLQSQTRPLTMEDFCAKSLNPTAQEALEIVLAKLDQFLVVSGQRKGSGSYQKDYFLRARRFLFGESRKKPGPFSCDRSGFGRGGGFEIECPFYCPSSVGSASFGLTKKRGKKEKEIINPTEPYRSYYVEKGKIDDYLSASQILVTPDEEIYHGVFLVLSFQKQREYFVQSIRPLLQQFVAHLPRCPEGFFEQVGKNEGALREEIKNLATIMQAVEFVRRYIIIPTFESEKQEKTDPSSSGRS